MRVGLIAGNGRFPFLALDALRTLGHKVTVVAIREETDPRLEEATITATDAKLHWVSLGQLGKCIAILKDAGDFTGTDGGPGQTQQALCRGSARLDALVGITSAARQQYRRAHFSSSRCVE